MNKKLIILAVLIIAVIGVFIVVTTNKKITLNINGNEVELKYSSLKFKCIQDNSTEGVLESKNENIEIKINNNLTDTYSSYNLLKDYKMMAYNGQETDYNNISCFYYYDEAENRYVVISEIDDKSYLEIYIMPKENSNKSAEETFNQKKVQKVLQTLEIKH